MRVAIPQMLNYNPSMRWAELVRERREKLGWNRKELSERAGVSSAVITRIEQGKTIGRGDTIARITAALGLDAEEVTATLGGEYRSRVAKSTPDTETVMRELVALFGYDILDLSPSARQSVIDYVRFVIRQEKARRKKETDRE